MPTRSRSVLIVSTLAIGLSFACSKSDESVGQTSQATTWQCAQVPIENGDTMECTQESGDSTSDSESDYDCTASHGRDKCPPSGAKPGKNDCGESTSDSGSPQPGNGHSGGNGGTDDLEDDEDEKNGKGLGNGGKGGKKDEGDEGEAGGSGSTGESAVADGGSASTPDDDEGNGETFHCSKKNGKRTCKGTKPHCSRGHHPTACGACAPAGCNRCDGCPSSCGCVPPADGGATSTQTDGGATSVNNGLGCTLTQGYWKNHASAWPAQTLTIGGVSYSQAELLTLFRTAPSGDASLVLEHQLAAALLNAARGASQTQVGAAIAEAQAWFSANKDADGRLPYGVSTSSPAGAKAVEISSRLDSYNNGRMDIPHCN